MYTHRRHRYIVQVAPLKVLDLNTSTPIILKDVLHAPHLALTVISVDRISQAGYLVTFEDGVCKVAKKGGKVIGTIPRSAHGMYKVERAYAAIVAPERVSLHSLHRRLVHIAPNTIRVKVLRP